MDINAAIEHMRSRNEPMYGAWEVCKAAGIDPKRQSRLFARNRSSSRSWMSAGAFLHEGQDGEREGVLAGVKTPSILNKPENAQKIREEHLEVGIRRSTEKARESRRHYKKVARKQQLEKSHPSPISRLRRPARSSR